jgi:nitrate/TMAO reductase-like tetraheme cytochrome c subunit
MGDTEINNCNFCHVPKPVLRKYIRVPHNENFVIIRYCNDCGEPYTGSHVPNDGNKETTAEYMKRFLGEKL